MTTKEQKKDLILKKNYLRFLNKLHKEQLKLQLFDVNKMTEQQIKRIFSYYFVSKDDYYVLRNPNTILQIDNDIFKKMNEPKIRKPREKKPKKEIKFLDEEQPKEEEPLTQDITEEEEKIQPSFKPPETTFRSKYGVSKVQPSKEKIREEIKILTDKIKQLEEILEPKKEIKPVEASKVDIYKPEEKTATEIKSELVKAEKPEKYEPPTKKKITKSSIVEEVKEEKPKTIEDQIKDLEDKKENLIKDMNEKTKERIKFIQDGEPNGKPLTKQRIQQAIAYFNKYYIYKEIQLVDEIDILIEDLKKSISKEEPIKDEEKREITIDDFKDVGFLRDGIELYYRYKNKKLTNLGKANKEKLIEIINKRKIDLYELAEFYNMAINRELDNIKNNKTEKAIKRYKSYKKLLIELKKEGSGKKYVKKIFKK